MLWKSFCCIWIHCMLPKSLAFLNRLEISCWTGQADHFAFENNQLKIKTSKYQFSPKDKKVCENLCATFISKFAWWHQTSTPVKQIMLACGSDIYTCVPKQTLYNLMCSAVFYIQSLKSLENLFISCWAIGCCPKAQGKSPRSNQSEQVLWTSEIAKNRSKIRGIAPKIYNQEEAFFSKNPRTEIQKPC